MLQNAPKHQISISGFNWLLMPTSFALIKGESGRNELRYKQSPSSNLKPPTPKRRQSKRRRDNFGKSQSC